jgi:hypothetical protein
MVIWPCRKLQMVTHKLVAQHRACAGPLCCNALY